MTPEQFRRHGYQVIDWLADYIENVEEYPVLSRVRPGAIRSRLPETAPEAGEPFELVLRDLDQIILPGITHWQSPGFFAYFPANASPASILGDLVSSGLGVQGMLWSTSPACTELETHVLDWFVDLMGLPAGFKSDGPGGGVIQDTASSSTLSAIVASRIRVERHMSPGHVNQSSVERRTANGASPAADLVAYTSREAHSSVEKGIRIAGIPRENLRLVDVDRELAMDADALAHAISEDTRAGCVPFFVCATIGTTGTTAIDPVRRIGELARKHGAWFHVDAAYAGSATVCPELRWTHDGVELADSYTFNPHKWLLTNFDCNVLYVKDRSAVIDAFSITPEYLRNAASESGDVIDYRDWHVQLGRRFRALKLWFVLRHYGAEGLRAHIRKHIALAQYFAGLVAASDDYELVTPATFGLVCFRHVAGDEATRAVMDRINDSGRACMTHTVVDGRVVLRLAIGGVRTEKRHIDAVWEGVRS